MPSVHTMEYHSLNVNWYRITSINSSDLTWRVNNVVVCFICWCMHACNHDVIFCNMIIYSFLFCHSSKECSPNVWLWWREVPLASSVYWVHYHLLFIISMWLSEQPLCHQSLSVGLEVLARFHSVMVDHGLINSSQVSHWHSYHIMTCSQYWFLEGIGLGIARSLAKQASEPTHQSIKNRFVVISQFFTSVNVQLLLSTAGSPRAFTLYSFCLHAPDWYRLDI